MPQLIDGKAISLQIKNEVRDKVAAYKEQGITISLAVIQVGNDPASGVYVGNKKKHVNMSEFVPFLMNFPRKRHRKRYWI